MKIAIITSHSNKEFKASLILRKFLACEQLELQSILVVNKKFKKFNKYYFFEKIISFLDLIYCYLTNFLFAFFSKTISFNQDFNSRRFFRISEVLRYFDLKNTDLNYFRTLNSNEVRNYIIEKNIDLLILAGVGIVKQNILSIPKLKIINVHSSVLPGYRGTESEIFAISDENYHLVGNTVHFVNEKIDSGEILSVKKVSCKNLSFSLSYLRYYNKVSAANNLLDTVLNFKNIKPQINDISQSVYRSKPNTTVIKKAKRNLKRCK